MPHNVSLTSLSHLFTHTIYPLYTLAALFLIYLLNQIDRYLITVHATRIKLDTGISDAEYGILTGLGFTIIYTISGVLIGLLADQRIIRRVFILFAALIFWSLMTFLTSFSREFWHLLLTRIGLAVGEAASSPLSYSLLADYFTERHISKVMSVYSFGIYCGYGAAFSVAALIADWRWSFGVLGVTGMLVAIGFVVTVWEPKWRVSSTASGADTDRIESVEEALDEAFGLANEVEAQPLFPSVTQSLSIAERIANKVILPLKTSWNPPLWRFALCRSSFWLLCLAAGARNYVGYAQAAWLPTFYTRIHDQSSEEQARWFTWIPPVFGVLSATCGGILGDFLTNRLKSNRGRILVCIASNVFVLPVLCAVLLVSNTTLSYLLMIVHYLFAEQWAGNASALIALVVPAEIRTLMMSIYFLVLSLIGGCAPYVVGVLNDTHNEGSILMNLLVNMGVGYVVSSAVFFVALIMIDRDARAVKSRAGN